MNNRPLYKIQNNPFKTFDGYTDIYETSDIRKLEQMYRYLTDKYKDSNCGVFRVQVLFCSEYHTIEI